MSVERWSVWRANLDPVMGSEQGMTRPVLVISQTALNDILPVVNVLPLTSRKAGRRVYPNEALLPAGTTGLTLQHRVASQRTHRSSGLLWLCRNSIVKPGGRCVQPSQLTLTILSSSPAPCAAPPCRRSAVSAGGIPSLFCFPKLRQKFY